jgi:hypothetical protein
VRNGYGQGRSLGREGGARGRHGRRRRHLPEVISKYARRTTETANKTRAEAMEEIQIRIAAVGSDDLA